MGYGPNIIEGTGNRLDGGIGNWISHNGGGDGGFIAGGGGAVLFQNSYLARAWGTLGKDFFGPLVDPGQYQITFDILWPANLYSHSADFSIIAGPFAAYGVSWPNTPTNTWRNILSNFTTDPLFDNDLRELRFQLTNIEHEDVSVFIENLSIRRYTPSKNQYLPLMGVG